MKSGVRSGSVTSALSVSRVRKTYKGGVEALKEVSLEVKEGDFFALLGPNGAGKSTLIGMVTSLVNKDSGKIQVFGHDLDQNVIEVKKNIGLVPQEFNFNIFETVSQILIHQAGYYGVNKALAMRRTEKYLNQLGLWEKRNVQSMRLSGGMKRRLMIARALIHEPRLLILDEPTAGVDIELRRSTWRFLTNLNRERVTIILTTHYLEEAENLCKNVAIINHGEIIANTSVKKLIKQLDSQIFILDIKEKIKKIPLVKGYTIKKIDEQTLEVEVNQEKGIHRLLQGLNRAQLNVLSMKNKTNRLEELFVKLLK